MLFWRFTFPPYLFIGEVWVRSRLGLKIDLTRLNPFVHQHLKPVGLGVRSNYKNRQMSNKDIRFSHHTYRLLTCNIAYMYIVDIGSAPCRYRLRTMSILAPHDVDIGNLCGVNPYAYLIIYIEHFLVFRSTTPKWLNEMKHFCVNYASFWHINTTKDKKKSIKSQFLHILFVVYKWKHYLCTEYSLKGILGSVPFGDQPASSEQFIF